MMANLYRKSANARLSERTPTMTNFADRTIWTGDILDILRGLNSTSVDLIHLDPPFNPSSNCFAPTANG